MLFIVKSRQSIHQYDRNQKTMKILDAEIDNLSRIDILTQVERFLDEPKFHQIATVNPEFLVEADRNLEFKNVLNSCDLRVADGFGITLASFFSGERLKCRFPGADLMEEVLKIANEKKLSVYLAVRSDGLSSYDEVRDILLRRYPGLRVDGEDIDMYQASEYKIQNTKYDILLCNFGAPAQELFLAKFKDEISELRIGMGVGGAFDYLAGKQKRAPKWLRAIGLEWLWRLICQPSRIIRIWNATVVFLFKVIKSAILKPLFK